ncbi:MAG: phage major capsid protein [Polyangiaceae bacterium]|nr:phage major capsid protein [Polyangiaceae bacterium]
MADTPQTLALLALGQKYRGKIVPQINRLSATLRVLPMIPGGGKNVAWVAEGDSEDAENYADGADAANFSSDSQNDAILSWARVRKNFKITDTARAAAQTNEAGPDGLKDLIAHNIITQSGKVASKVNLQIFSGDGTSDALTGFDTAIGDDTNTYATIVRGTDTYWKPTVVDPGSLTPLTFAQVRSDRTAIFKKSGENPDLAFVPPEVFDAWGNLYDATRRYVQEVTTPRGTVKLNAGFEGLEFDGMVILKDKDATANRIYYVNSNYVHLEYLPLSPATVAALMTMGIDMKADDGFGMTPLGIRCEKLAKTGDADKYMVKTTLQLVVRRPNTCGVRKNVAT